MSTTKTYSKMWQMETLVLASNILEHCHRLLADGGSRTEREEQVFTALLIACAQASVVIPNVTETLVVANAVLEQSDPEALTKWRDTCAAVFEYHAEFFDDETGVGGITFCASNDHAAELQAFDLAEEEMYEKGNSVQVTNKTSGRTWRLDL